MQVWLGLALAIFGAFFAAAAKGLERGNSAGSKFLFGEKPSEKGSNFHLWVLRIGGSVFCIFGILVATGVIKLAETR
ncbi:hypothetical protein [Streptomyces tauricus]|uniref:hypothetical protein n=1 Tax=Streptomyces tauricus TaxID=68274 RepID=UPI0016761024|nr:hypothetical protein [Streptomyces tauricus]